MSGTTPAEKKLFTCSVSIGLMVWAEDEEEARALAEEYLPEEIGNVPPTQDEFIVNESLTSSKKHVYAENWTDTDCPYSADDSESDETVGDRFKELETR